MSRFRHAGSMERASKDLLRSTKWFKKEWYWITRTWERSIRFQCWYDFKLTIFLILNLERVSKFLAQNVGNDKLIIPEPMLQRALPYIAGILFIYAFVTKIIPALISKYRNPWFWYIICLGGYAFAMAGNYLIRQSAWISSLTIFLQVPILQNLLVSFLNGKMMKEFVVELWNTYWCLF